MFDDTNNAPIYVPAESVEAYKSAQYWSDYADRIYAIGTPMAVDLGLSVKWASFNVGATTPEEYGDYYAWGETEPYYISLDPLVWKEGYEDGYCVKNYKWYSGSESRILKYCSESTGFMFWVGDGPVDNKTQLDLEDDAAYVNIGNAWRMPTNREWLELIENCTWTWSTINGIRGYIISNIVDGNTTSIFLPLADHWFGLSSGYGSCYYYSTSLNVEYPDLVWCVALSPSSNYTSGNYENTFVRRYTGCSIRPVYAE